MNPARCESGFPLRSAHSMNKELTTVAKSIQRRDVKAGRVNRVALVLSIILLIALIGSIYANRFASGQTDIFTKVGYGASLQNSEILVDDNLGITFLGTYQNTVLAFDNAGEMLTRVEQVFWSVAAADTNPQMQAVQEKVAPMLSSAQDSDANTMFSPTLPMHSGLKPYGSRAAMSLRGDMTTSEYAP